VVFRLCALVCENVVEQARAGMAGLTSVESGQSAKGSR
jgi:hypothetical protein